MSSSGVHGVCGWVDCKLVFSWSRWPLDDALLWGRCLDRRLVVKPGQVVKNCLRSAYLMVDGRGLNKAAA